MALFDTNQGGGFFDSLPNIFMTPDFSQTGILTTDQQKDLRNQATKAGLLGTALTYFATPQTENYGSIVPYLAKAGLGGMGAAQDVYGAGLTNLYRQRLSAGRDNEFSSINPLDVTSESLKAYQDSVAQGKPDRSLLRRAAPVEKPESFTDAYKNISLLEFGTANPAELTKEQRAKLSSMMKSAGGGLGLKDIYSEPQKDVNGNLVYVPKVPGYPIRDISGKPIAGNIQLKEKDAKPATESQAKAATFYSQMTSASDELRKLQQEGFDPSSPISQTAVTLAGTPLRGIAGQQAQRAKQIQEQWAEAFLRIKTGAAAQKQEVKLNVETFFPKFGETDPQIIAQKERARAQAEQDVLRMTKEGGGSVGAKPKELSAQDKQALDWANSNATDPRAAQIKQRLGL
jgi:hypothetical protein